MLIIKLLVHFSYEYTWLVHIIICSTDASDSSK